MCIAAVYLVRDPDGNIIHTSRTMEEALEWRRLMFSDFFRYPVNSTRVY